MSSLIQEYQIFTVPSQNILKPTTNLININNSIFNNSQITNLTVSNVNGEPIVGNFLTTENTAYVYNKTFDGPTTFIGNSANNNSLVQIIPEGTGGTASVLFNQIQNRQYNVPDTGTNSNFIMSNSDQTINDNITFNGSIITNTINSSTNITSVNGINLGLINGSYAGAQVGSYIKNQLGLLQTINDSVESNTVILNSNMIYAFTVSCIATDSSGDSLYIKQSNKLTCVNDTISIGTTYESISVVDSPLNGASISLQGNTGPSITITVNGVNGYTLNWNTMIDYMYIPIP